MSVSCMSQIIIRLSRRTDVASIYELCRHERWNYSISMISRLLAYEPKGCFLAEVNGEFAGQVFSISYGKIGWIGVLIVSEKDRRRGVGTLLMKHSIRYLLGLGVETIRLEAVPEIANLYRKLGFVDEFNSIRFVGTNRKQELLSGLNIKKAGMNEMSEIADFDRKYFGGDRKRVLKHLFCASPELCFYSQEGSKIAGYIISYEMETGYRIGPWVCNPNSLRFPTISRELLLTCMNKLEASTQLHLGVPETSNTAIRILHSLGFRMIAKCVRMRFGKKPQEKPRALLSIGGPENG